MAAGATPKVSIGLPVYNGENYLRQALDSVLGQTYRNLEVLISDNASTDGTAKICAEYVATDARVKYHRNEKNVGPDMNFNLTVDLATGEYFRWVAHDDLMDPECIAKCVAVLDANPDVILCHSLTKIIDHENRQLVVYDSGLSGSESARPSRRFASLILNQHICSEMFGLMRIEALRRSRRLEGNYYGSDRAMLAELSLIGAFANIAEPLFWNREHSARAVRAIKPSQRFAERQLNVRDAIGLNTLRLYRDYCQAVSTHCHTLGERLRCRMHLALWWFVSWNTLRVGAELIAQVCPGFYDVAKRMKTRYTRPAHPLAHFHSKNDN